MLFKGILQGLGYLCYTTAARINFDWDMASPPKFCGMGHTVNIVLPIDGPDGTAPVPHVVDVGYGGHGDISMLYRPLPLIDGTVVSSFTPPEEHRLLRATRPDDECALAESGWVLQVRVAPSEPWRLSYWINLAEFTETDWEWINFSMSKLPTAPMYNMLVCIKLHELPTGEIARTSIWSARAVRKVGAKKEVLERWEWEEERIDGISRLCGMKLDMREAIAGAREKPGMALPIREDAQLDGRCDAINTSLLN
ncbi:hypothetical protein B0J17DRAFT_677525 [Rhizoctonia solani]|nr:hypothetical protein B0J17DRAFT_677525 [Rhizoctonia solani]